MKIFKILLINIFLILSILGIFFFTPPITFLIYEFFNKSAGKTSHHKYKKESEVDLFKDYSWSKKHFNELGQLTVKYNDYISWRRDDFVGETINIKNGLRKTFSINNSTKKFWFFGGSTTWGKGVSDEYTYPSLFSALNNVQSKNFGENGYISRQSLAYLINYIIVNEIEDLSDIHVIFFDGVNDVFQKCQNKSNILSTSREDVIRRSIDKSHMFSFKKTFEQLLAYIMLIQSKFKNKYDNEEYSKFFNCYKNKKHAKKVATTLVDTWSIASKLVRAKGGSFTAILQPVAYIGKSEYEHLDLRYPDVLSKEYQSVYPLIRANANISDFKFVDLTNIYDGCKDCYFDFNHVGPQGNKILASSLSKILINKYK